MVGDESGLTPTLGGRSARLHFGVNMINTYGDLLHILSVMRKPGNGIPKVAREAVGTPLSIICDLLVRAIRSENQHVQGEALSLLASISPPYAATIAIDLLNDQDPLTKWMAFRILEQVGDVIDEGMVLSRLQIERDPEVRFAAVSALGKVGTLTCLPLLRDIQTNDTSTDFEGRPMSELIPIVFERIKHRYPHDKTPL